MERATTASEAIGEGRNIAVEPDGVLPAILLVEDSPADAALVRELLRDAWGERLEVARVDRVAGAVESLADSDADCILLDLSLPDADGLDAVRRMQAAAPEVAIVVLTGLDDEQVGLSAVQEGAQDYLIKGNVDGRLMTRSIRYAIERKRAEVALSHQALHDALTGLPNRALFLDRLQLALARSRRSHAGVAVLFLDVDRFKVINDSLGHDAGDRLLVSLSHRLSESLRPGDTVARFGGDEFTVLCEEVGSERDAVAIADRVRDATAEAFDLGGTEVVITASVGIAIAEDADSQPGALVRDADAAMYRAKENGRARYELFDATLRERAVGRLELEHELRQALDGDQFRVHFQPTVDLTSEDVVGVEALVRWEHPRRGLVLPEDFIGLAEETGLIVPLGEWVLRETCHNAERWHQQLGDRGKISVNLSARQLAQTDLVDVVARAIAESRIDPRQICLEITETLIVEDTETRRDRIRKLKAQGVRIAIDDFGTGYASLAMLKRLPADVLKVDRSFVAGLGTDEQDAPIVEAIIRIARQLGMDVIAEGVETPEQARLLREMGCRFAQGFHFSRPIDAEAIAELLRASM